MYHLSAVRALTKPQKDIGEMLSKKHLEEKKLFGRMLMNVMQSLLFLARQGIPLRGHTDVEGNLIQSMKLRGNDQQASMTTNTILYVAI